MRERDDRRPRVNTETERYRDTDTGIHRYIHRDRESERGLSATYYVRCSCEMLRACS